VKYFFVIIVLEKLSNKGDSFKTLLIETQPQNLI